MIVKNMVSETPAQPLDKKERKVSMLTKPLLSVIMKDIF